MKRISILAVAAVLSVSSVGLGEVRKEDLHDVKLPTNEVLIPIASTPEARRGHIYQIEDERWGAIPPAEPGQRRTSAEMIEAIKNIKAGDISFFSRDNTLWAISGRISDLGEVYLHEAAAQKLERPAVYKGQLPGAMPNIKAGNTYLVETVDGKFALVRVLQLTPVGPQVQVVYQPNGTMRFDMPAKPDLVALTPVVPMKEEPLPVPPVAVTPTPTSVGTTVSVMGNDPFGRPVAPPPTITAVTSPATPPSAPTEEPKREPTVLEPYMSSHIRQREAMVKTRIATIALPAKSKIEITKKADAMADLAALRANEAVDALIDQIDFMNTATRIKEFSIEAYHPAVGALIQLGKPATKGAIKALVAGPAGDAEAREMKQMLLIKVIRGVEGDDVAKLLLEKEVLPKVDEPRRAWMKEQLTKF